MGTPRAPWQNIVCICPQVTSISTAATFLSTDDAIETGKPGLPVLNRDYSLNPGQRFIEERQAFGISNLKKEERKLDRKLPSVTLEFPVNAYNLKLLLWLFFQKGMSEADTSPYVGTCVPYTDCDCEVWATVADPITGALSSGDNEAIHGAIVRSLTISGEEGGQIKGSAEFVGANYTDTFNTANAVVTVSTQTALLYRDTVIALDNNQIYIPSFSVTLEHDVASLNYNSMTMRKHVLGDLVVTGELVIPRDSGSASEDDEAQITDLLAGDDKKLVIYWGNSPASSTGDVSIVMDILYKEKEKVSDNEIGTRLPFEQVAGNDNLSITVADGIDRGIP